MGTGVSVPTAGAVGAARHHLSVKRPGLFGDEAASGKWAPRRDGTRQLGYSNFLHCASSLSGVAGVIGKSNTLLAGAPAGSNRGPILNWKSLKIKEVRIRRSRLGCVYALLQVRRASLKVASLNLGRWLSTITLNTFKNQ